MADELRSTPDSDAIVIDDDDKRRLFVESKRGFNLAVSWIRAHKTDVPENLRCRLSFDDDGLSMAVYWMIIMRQKIDQAILNGMNVNSLIPKWMEHPAAHQDSHGWTTAMHWVNTFAFDVPEWMRHKSTLQNRSGRTVAMIYILAVGSDSETDEMPTDIPQWMWHKNDIIDSEGFTLTDYWSKCFKTPLPSWLQASTTTPHCPSQPDGDVK